MKSIAIFSALFFYSIVTYADTYFTGITGSRGYNETYSTVSETSYSEGAINPYYEDLIDYDTEDNDTFFVSGNKLVFRDMYVSRYSAATQDINKTLLIEWQTYDVYDSELWFYIQGATPSLTKIDLPGSGYGYFFYDMILLASQAFEFGIKGKANSLQSQFEYKFSFYDGQDPSGQLFAPQIVPIPAAFWLFLPSLLGFIAYRRRSQ